MCRWITNPPSRRYHLFSEYGKKERAQPQYFHHVCARTHDDLTCARAHSTHTYTHPPPHHTHTHPRCTFLTNILYISRNRGKSADLTSVQRKERIKSSQCGAIARSQRYASTIVCVYGCTHMFAVYSLKIQQLPNFTQ